MSRERLLSTGGGEQRTKQRLRDYGRYDVCSKTTVKAADRGVTAEAESRGCGLDVRDRDESSRAVLEVLK